MKRWLTWILASVIAFVVAAFAFMNFSATISLGYDRHPGGQEIIVRWGVMMLGSFTAAVMFGLVAMFIWWRGRKARTVVDG